MNGRVYDYNLGRFLSVDPVIQAPTSTQSPNPYSYIMNNPLAGIDPTGYSSCGPDSTKCKTEIKISQTGSAIKKSVTATTTSDGNGSATITFSGADKGSRVAARNAVAGKLTSAGFQVSNVGSPGAVSQQEIAKQSGNKSHRSEPLGNLNDFNLSSTMDMFHDEQQEDELFAGRHGDGEAGVILGEAALDMWKNPEKWIPKRIVVDPKKHPESAQHIKDAQKNGRPTVLTVDRKGKKSRRRAALKGIRTKKGKDRDEYPPAMFKEGGAGSSVRHIKSGDNRGSGSCIGNQCRDVKDGQQVELVVEGDN